MEKKCMNCQSSEVCEIYRRFQDILKDFDTIYINKEMIAKECPIYSKRRINVPTT